MPKPVFIICSQSGSDDRFTGLLSLFNVIDRIRIARRSEHIGGASLSTTPRFRVTASWLREDPDKSREFEYEVLALLPPTGSEFTLRKGTFIFNRPFKRLTAKIIKPIPFEEGVLTVQCRVRLLGENQWIVQETPIVIERFSGSPLAIMSRQDAV